MNFNISAATKSDARAALALQLDAAKVTSNEASMLKAELSRILGDTEVPDDAGVDLAIVFTPVQVTVTVRK